MGQKVNPNIFRLEKTNNWPSKYFEKKSTEFAIYGFYDSEIHNFIYQFFEDNGLMIDCIKTDYSLNSCHIFISYFATLKSIKIVSNINHSQKINLTISSRNENKDKEKYVRIKTNTQKYLIYEKLKNYFLFKNYKYYSNLKKLIYNNKLIFKTRRLKHLKYYKKCFILQNYSNIKNINNNLFLENFFISLNSFIDTDINLTLQRLNKNSRLSINKDKFKSFNKALVCLKKYKQNSFFKEGLNILFTYSKSNNSSFLLAHFIATELKNLKQHNLFLKFLKTSLNLIGLKTFSHLKGIKIKIKGRLSGIARARNKILIIGTRMPIISINSNINYGETISYTNNGIIGVKVWTFYAK
jgi:hypothetical protein